MQIYSFPTFNLTKILLTAQEAGEPFQLNMLDLTQGEHKSAEHLARHPLGKVPAVEIDGQHYFESNAICRFICERNDNKLYGNALEQRALVNQWVDMATLHVGRWLTVMFYERIIKPKFFEGQPDPTAVDEAETFLAQQLPVIEQQLTLHAFVAGDDFSIADIIAFSYLSTTEITGVDLSSYSKISQWLNDIKARPSFDKAMSHLPDGDILAIFR